MRYYRNEEIDEIPCAGHTFLFGISGLLFAQKSNSLYEEKMLLAVDLEKGRRCPCQY